MVPQSQEIEDGVLWNTELLQSTHDTSFRLDDREKLKQVDTICSHHQTIHQEHGLAGLYAKRCKRLWEVLKVQEPCFITSCVFAIALKYVSFLGILASLCDKMGKFWLDNLVNCRSRLA